jgi:hypothetical protein
LLLRTSTWYSALAIPVLFRLNGVVCCRTRAHCRSHLSARSSKRALDDRVQVRLLIECNHNGFQKCMLINFLSICFQTTSFTLCSSYCVTRTAAFWRHGITYWTTSAQQTQTALMTVFQAPSSSNCECSCLFFSCSLLIMSRTQIAR